MSTMSLAISGISIRQDSHGRFCLNDLHKAAGGERRHEPANWTALQQVQELIKLLESEELNYDTGIPVSSFSPLEIVKGRGKVQGTFVVKELVYAYATWISAKFFLTVIRAYDSLVNPQQQTSTTITDAEYKTLTNAMKAACFVGKVFDKSAYTKMIGELTTAYGKRKLEQLPAGKVSEMLVFLKLRQPKHGEMMLVAVEEFESLQALRALPPAEQQVFPDNYHQYIDLVNKMESANYRIFKKDVLVALHEMLTKMI